MAEILIDKDRFDFLQYAFFGGDKPFPAVSVLDCETDKSSRYESRTK